MAKYSASVDNYVRLLRWLVAGFISQAVAECDGSADWRHRITEYQYLLAHKIYFPTIGLVSEVGWFLERERSQAEILSGVLLIQVVEQPTKTEVLRFISLRHVTVSEESGWGQIS